MLKENLIITKQYDKPFKLDTIYYYEYPKDLGARECTGNLDIEYSILTKWLKDFRETVDISVYISGNYTSDE